jgi:hypothetical protein
MTIQLEQDSLPAELPELEIGRPPEFLNLAEWTLALLMTALAVIAHCTVLLCAGHLWRDEAVSVDLATLPTIHDIWRDLQTDSFPLAWPLLLRTWAAIVGAGNDQGLRVLGFLIGVALLSVLWFHATQTAARLPLLGLAFAGLNAAAICYGDSIRGYGLGMLSGALTVLFFWRAIQRSNALNWTLASLAAFLSVHCVFHNAAFLLASCCGTMAVLALQRRWRTALLPPAIGLASALSMLPYSLTLKSAKQWTPVFQFPMTFSRMLMKVAEAFVGSGTLVFVLWLWAIGAGVLLTNRSISLRGRKALTVKCHELLIFSGVTMIVGIIGQFAFLWALHYSMNPWYFLPMLVIVGISLDGIAAAYPGSATRVIRIAVAIVVSICSAVPLLRTCAQLKTNVNLITARIQKEAKPGDVVVVNSWWVGYTFEREYAGNAPWTTIPPIPFPRSPGQISQLALRRQMEDPDHAMDPVLAKVATALRQGGRVWIVGPLTSPSAGSTPAAIAAYKDTSALKDGSYYDYWTDQLGTLLRGRSIEVKKIPVDGRRTVSEYENQELRLARESPSPERDSATHAQAAAD